MAAAPRGYLVVTSLTLGTIISLPHVLDSMAIRSTAMLTIANKTYRQLNITKRDDTVTLISMFHCDSNVSPDQRERDHDALVICSETDTLVFVLQVILSKKNVNVSIESDFLQPRSSINNSICTARPPGLRPKHQDLYVLGIWLRKISAIKDMK